MRMHVLWLWIALMFAGPAAKAHPGGLNREGCHNDRKHGTGYHCHRGGAVPRRAAPQDALGFSPQPDGRAPSSGGEYPNCAAARAAGAAPVRRGDPGYGSHLDRDGDGVGCEPHRGRR
jgi:hypothetical protein